MKTTETAISKSLLEVWEWKDAVYQDIKDKSADERKAYFHEGVEIAAKILGSRVVVNPDGSRCLV
jgi:hypothetical protein